MRLNHSTLIDSLAEIAGRGTIFLTVRAVSDARLRKSGNPFALPVSKEQTVNGYVNFDYVGGVQRKRGKEGNADEFIPGESWHTAVFTARGLRTPCCRHKKTGELYLRFAYLSTIGESVYSDATGRTLSFAEVSPYLPKRSDYTRQQLDNPLVFLTFRLDSIREIRCRLDNSDREMVFSLDMEPATA